MWISIKDKLPDESDMSGLFYVTNINVSSACFLALYYDKAKAFILWAPEYTGIKPPLNVTHYIKLPEAPKE